MTNFVLQFLDQYHITLIDTHNIDHRFLKDLYAVCISKPDELRGLVVKHMLLAHENAPIGEQRLAVLVELLALIVNQLSSDNDQVYHDQNKPITILENDIFLLERQLHIVNRQLHRRSVNEVHALLASSDEENIPSSPTKKPRVESGDGTLMSPQILKI